MKQPRKRNSSSGNRQFRQRQQPARKAETQSQCLTLEIDNLTSDGQGVGRRGREVYFVPGALPGETVDVVLDGRRKKVWQTRLRSVINESPERVEPACPHYHKCGGCDLQHLQYQSQVNAKQARAERELSRQGIDVKDWATAITDDAWHYRRKARLGVRFSNSEQVNYIGFRESASAHITNIDRCPVLIAHPLLDWAGWRELIASLQGRAAITQIEMIQADNAIALVLRAVKPLSTDDISALCQFVDGFDLSAELPVQLWLKEDKVGEAKCIYPQPDVSPVPEALWHQVGGLQLNMALSDFIQVNGAVNRAMVEQAISWLAPKQEDCIWDLFAGHGNFSMPLATRSQQVVAVEVQDSMAESLRQQAEKLALPLLGKTADLSEPGCLAELPSPDAVLLDPPRAGAAEVMKELIQRKVPKIVYVSCDVATLARDLSQLKDAGYEVIKAGIMDMFPQTHHLETMVLLQRERKRHG